MTLLVKGKYQSPSETAYEEEKKRKAQAAKAPVMPTPTPIAHPELVDINAANRANAATQQPTAGYDIKKDEAYNKWIRDQQNASAVGGGELFNNPYSQAMRDRYVAEKNKPLNATGDELFNAELAKQDKASYDLFGIHTPTTKAELAKKTKLEQEMERAKQEQQQSSNVRMMDIQNQQLARQSAGAEAASIAGLAQGREGPMSAGAPLAMSEAKAFYEQTRNIQNIKTAQIMADLASARTSLQKAQEDNNVQLAQSIRSNIVSLEQEQSKANLATQEALNQAAAIEVSQADNLSKVFTNFEKLPAGIFSTMTPEQISTGMGVELNTATVLKALDTQRALLQPTDPDYLKKVAELNKTIEETKYVGMTESQKNYLTYKSLLITDPEYAEKFAQSTNLSPTAKEQAETLKAQQEANLAEYDSSGVYNPIYSKYGVSYTPNGVRINVEANTVLDRWQCGAFVNDVLFGGPNAKGAGDSYASKKNMVNSTTPVAGGAVVFDTGDANGHIGIVERVYADGSFDMVDSNRKKNKNGIGIVDRTHLSPGDAWYKYATGFVDPAKLYSKSGGDEKTNLLAIIKAGKMTDSELTKTSRLAARQGWGDEFRAAIGGGQAGDKGMDEMIAEGVAAQLGTTSDERAAYKNNMLALVKSGKAKDVYDAKSQLRYITPSDTTAQLKAGEDLKGQREDMNTFFAQTAPIEDLLKSKSGMGDYASIVGFLKAIDPGSVARESEVESVQKASGFLQDIFTKLENKTLTGEKLTPTMRAEMNESINTIKNARAALYYERLIGRVLETEAKGIPLTFTSKAHIKEMERWIGKEKADEIKTMVKESLGADAGLDYETLYRGAVESEAPANNPYYFGPKQ